MQCDCRRSALHTSDPTGCNRYRRRIHHAQQNDHSTVGFMCCRSGPQRSRTVGLRMALEVSSKQALSCQFLSPLDDVRFIVVGRRLFIDCTLNQCGMVGAVSVSSPCKPSSCAIAYSAHARHNQSRRNSVQLDSWSKDWGQWLDAQRLPKAPIVPHVVHRHFIVIR